MAATPPPSASPTPLAGAGPPKKSVRETVADYLATKPSPEAMLAKGQTSPRTATGVRPSWSSASAAGQRHRPGRARIVLRSDGAGQGRLPARRGARRRLVRAGRARRGRRGAAQARLAAGQWGGAGLTADAAKAKSCSRRLRRTTPTPRKPSKPCRIAPSGLYAAAMPRPFRRLFNSYGPHSYMVGRPGTPTYVCRQIADLVPCLWGHHPCRPCPHGRGHPSSSREPLASGVGVVPEQWPPPATALKPMRLTCRLYFGCVPAFQPIPPRKGKPMTAVDVLSPVSSDALVDRVLAVAHLPPTAHVAVRPSYALHRARPDAARLRLRPQPASRGRLARPRDPPTLAWIVDVANEDELHDALQAARNRTGTSGRVVVEGRTAAAPTASRPSARIALAAGLDVVSFDHLSRRLVLAPAPPARLAA